MKKLPYLYEKILLFLDHAEVRKMDRDLAREDISRRFRISRTDTGEIFKELQAYGAIKKQSRGKIHL